MQVGVFLYPKHIHKCTKLINKAAGQWPVQRLKCLWTQFYLCIYVLIIYIAMSLCFAQML